ncbi:MAG: SBBP repeat-containing protein [PVC group bacterium]
MKKILILSALVLLINLNPEFLYAQDVQLSYSTYLGGSANDVGRDVAVGSDGTAFITGNTWSSDFPCQNGYQSVPAGEYDAFISRLSSSGSSLVYSTYLGGTTNEEASGIAVDTADFAYIVGSTDSWDFPVSNPYQSVIRGDSDSFACRLEHAATPTATITPTSTSSATPTPTPTSIPTVPPTPVPSATPTPSVTPVPTVSPTPEVFKSPTPVPAPTSIHLVIGWDDYNGDGYTDYALFTAGAWNIMDAQTATVITEGVIWGDEEGAIPAPGDYNGDGTGDIAYYNRFSARWYVKDTLTGEVITSGLKWGLYDDIPVPEDYDGDGTTDYATWSPSGSLGYWHIYGAASAWQCFGNTGDIPIPGDFDGDGTCDRALVRTSGASLRWLVREADGNNYNFLWGYPEDRVRALDYNGDGVSDPVVWRIYGDYHTVWFLRNIGKVRYGYAADTPVAGDFDGDGASNFGIFRPGERRWYIYNPSGPNFKQRYGVDGDIPVVGQSF